MQKYIQIQFSNITSENKEMLMALLENDSLLGFQEEGENEISAFFRENGFDESVLKSVVKELDIQYTVISIEERNWNAEWERGFSPILVINPNTQKPFAYIRADFHDSIAEVPHDLIVTPKMSFGTGHHATTMLMMEQMSQLDFSGKKVIDFGTGTGVLAILAYRMGAREIEAIDCDHWSIENAIENFDNNHCEGIILKQENAFVSTIGKVDIILANINLNVIKDNLKPIRHVSNEDVTILFSGVLESDLNAMIVLLSDYGFHMDSYFVKNNWLLIKASIHK